MKTSMLITVCDVYHGQHEPIYDQSVVGSPFRHPHPKDRRECRPSQGQSGQTPVVLRAQTWPCSAAQYRRPFASERGSGGPYTTRGSSGELFPRHAGTIADGAINSAVRQGQETMRSWGTNRKPEEDWPLCHRRSDDTHAIVLFPLTDSTRYFPGTLKRCMRHEIVAGNAVLTVS